MGSRIDLTTIDNLIDIWTRIKANGGIVDDGLVDAIKGSEDRVDEHEAKLAALKNLKALRNAQQLILRATESKIFCLQKETSMTTLQRGIHSLPDDVIREIFETGHYGLSEPRYRYGSESYPVNLSRVNRRFRTIAMDTPQIWSRLSNALTADQLEYRIEQSKFTGLTIIIMVHLDEDQYACTVAEFLKIITPFCHRWHHFEYVVGEPDRTEDVYFGYTYRALLDYPHLDLPHLTSFLWQKCGYDQWVDNPYVQAFCKLWNMPKLASFEGLNVLINPLMTVYNLVSVTLEFHADHQKEWDLDDTLAALASSTRLAYLCITFARIAPSPPNFQLPPTLLQNLVSFTIKLLKKVDEQFVFTFLSALKMPVLTAMWITLDLAPQMNHVRFIREVISTSRSHPKLQKFGLDITGFEHSILWNLVLTLGRLLPSLREVTLRGHGLCLSAGHLHSPVAWQLVRLRGFDKKSCEMFCMMAFTDAHWGSCKIDVEDERNLSAEVVHNLGDRLVYERIPEGPTYGIHDSEVYWGIIDARIGSESDYSED
ncbi:hypothetical protein BD410DRAFT_780723 [Rickenella mellea]|uniref:Uncharacterized protein n=1 Tax=Rickenella mellea TaxID=50990 RepID=A0A4R5XG99_9AGAM|nr:hypothetical protein BD410DRAFT_780723 [Rickenella mellea]